MFFEGLDNDHGGATVLAGVGGCREIILNDVCCWRDVILAEEFTQSLQLSDPGMVGEQSIVTDTVEA